MRLPRIAATTSFRAWVGGVALALFIAFVPDVTVLVGLRIPFVFYVMPVGFAVLAAYSMLVQPRLFAASGTLLGVAPWFAWGVIDGLEKCARFNRGGPSGGCEADPTAQIVLTVAVYVLALAVTGTAARSRSVRQ